MEPLRVLIVDDSTLYRKFIKDALTPLQGVEVAGVASNGRDALLRISLLHPDIVTLDVEMPGMSGIEVLSNLKDNGFDGAVIMLSSFTQKGTPLTIKALQLGAFDFILKPALTSMDDNLAALRQMFLPMAEALTQRKKINQLLQGKSLVSARSEAAAHRKIVSEQTPVFVKCNGEKMIPQIIAIGVSTGGPKALAEIIPRFPEGLQVPVVVVQHMPEEFTREFAKSLNSKSSLIVKEAEDGEPLRPGTVYIAPGGKQMKVVQAAANKNIQITDDPPENNCKPSVDYCFRSVAKLYGGNAMGVILTGMGRDGAAGSQEMKRHGAKIIAQDEKSSVVFGMPKAVIDTGVVDIVCSLDKMADTIKWNLQG